MTPNVKAVLLCLLLSACVPVDTGAGGSGGAADGGAYGGGGASVGSGSGGAAPSRASMVFSSPSDGGSCTLDHDLTCPVRVEVEGAVLAGAGKCGGSSGSCGHLELFIDGDACGRPNATSASRHFVAQLGKCARPTGPHDFRCELRGDREELLATTGTIRVQARTEEDGDGDGD